MYISTGMNKEININRALSSYVRGSSSYSILNQLTHISTSRNVLTSFNIIVLFIQNQPFAILLVTNHICRLSIKRHEIYVAWELQMMNLMFGCHDLSVPTNLYFGHTIGDWWAERQLPRTEHSNLIIVCEHFLSYVRMENLLRKITCVPNDVNKSSYSAFTANVQCVCPRLQLKPLVVMETQRLLALVYFALDEKTSWRDISSLKLVQILFFLAITRKVLSKLFLRKFAPLITSSTVIWYWSFCH